MTHRASPARPSSAPASFQTRCTLPHCRPRTDRPADSSSAIRGAIQSCSARSDMRARGLCRTRKATGTFGWASGKRGLRCWGCGGVGDTCECTPAERHAALVVHHEVDLPQHLNRQSVGLPPGGVCAWAIAATWCPRAAQHAPIAANSRERARVGCRCAGRSSSSARKLVMLKMG